MSFNPIPESFMSFSWTPKYFGSVGAVADTFDGWAADMKQRKKDVKKVVKIVQKGLGFTASCLRGTAILSDLKTSLSSPSALKTYVLLTGSAVLTYLNSTSSSKSGFNFGTAKALGCNFFQELRKITTASGMIYAVAEIVKNPKAQIIPYACAGAMFLIAEKWS